MRGHEPLASTWLVRIVILRDADQTARRFPPRTCLLRSETTSKETFCPSLRPCILARSITLMYTKPSLPPSVEPLHGSLRHITLPSGRCERRPRASAAG